MRTLPLIVVIEPEWPTRSYLRAELEELGYEILVFDDPLEAARATRVGIPAEPRPR